MGIGDGFASAATWPLAWRLGGAESPAPDEPLAWVVARHAGSDDIDLRKHVGRIPGTCAALLPDGPDSAGWTHNTRATVSSA